MGNNAHTKSLIIIMMKRLLLSTMLAHSVNLHLTILLRSFFDPSAVTAPNNEKYKIETYRPTKPSNNEKRQKTCNHPITYCNGYVRCNHEL